jgi:hypothetical protein
LEVEAEGGFKLDLRQDCDPGRQDRDPGKQTLKGAVRTETYWCHYCQHMYFRISTVMLTSTSAFHHIDKKWLKNR